MSKTPAQRGDLGRRRKASSQKAAARSRLRADEQRAVAARKQSESGNEEGVAGKGAAKPAAGTKLRN